MKEFAIAIGGGTIITIILVLGLYGLFCIDESHDRKEYTPLYNNGIHADCGDHWHIVTQGKYSYTYECDKCGTTFKSCAKMK